METRKVYKAFRSYFPRISARDALRVAREVETRGLGYNAGNVAFTVSLGTVAWRPTEYPPTSPYNPRIENTSKRWIENTDRAGLRFVGYADELAGRSIEHTGWYLDGEFPDSSETYRGAVWQLPARDGCAVYVYGYSDPFNDGAALIDFDAVYGERGGNGSWDHDDSDAQRTAAGYADSMAEHDAELEREYQSRWNAARRIEDLREELAGYRETHGKLCSELRTMPKDIAGEYPTACDAIRGKLYALRDGARQNVKDIREILSLYGDEILTDEYA